MKKAIVTGAAGFIGTAVIDELLQNGYFVFATDLEAVGEKVLPHKNKMFVPCDLMAIENLCDIIPSGDYDVFYHFAWIGSAGPQRADVSLQLQNAESTVRALRVAKALGCKRFVSSGSIMEHETIAAAYKSGNKPGLGYIYGSGKLVAHTMCMSVAAEIGIELICPKITNAYGVGETSPRMVNTALRSCIKKQPPVFTAATQNYDFIYIDDVATAFRLIAENGKPFTEYIIGSSNAKPLKQFLQEMQRSVAPDLEFVFGDIPFTGVDMPLSTFDCSITEQDTGFKAKVSFGEGCKKTYDWLKEVEND